MAFALMRLPLSIDQISGDSLPPSCRPSSASLLLIPCLLASSLLCPFLPSIIACLSPLSCPLLAPIPAFSPSIHPLLASSLLLPFLPSFPPSGLPFFFFPTPHPAFLPSFLPFPCSCVHSFPPFLSSFLPSPPFLAAASDLPLP